MGPLRSSIRSLGSERSGSVRPSKSGCKAGTGSPRESARLQARLTPARAQLPPRSKGAGPGSSYLLFLSGSLARWLSPSHARGHLHCPARCLGTEGDLAGHNTLSGGKFPFGPRCAVKDGWARPLARLLFPSAGRVSPGGPWAAPAGSCPPPKPARCSAAAGERVRDPPRLRLQSVRLSGDRTVQLLLRSKSLQAPTPAGQSRSPGVES